MSVKLADPCSPKLSYIIPCYNSEGTISETLRSIKNANLNNNSDYEIIVVDNVSTDKSVELANKEQVLVVTSKSKTVSGVRNDGAFKSIGEILVFIDADVEIGKNWRKVFNLMGLRRDARIITGSHCTVPENIKQPFFSWYKSIEEDERDTHVGSGHLIIPRLVFDELGGFNDSLKSGEDYDLCRRAKQRGVSVNANCSLVAKHLGYPTTLRHFFIRECWHGESDVVDFKSFFSSKIAIAAISFLLLNVMGGLSVIFGGLNFFVFLVIFDFLFLSSFVYLKFGVRNIKYFVFNVLVSILYLLGRACSIVYPFFRGRSFE